MTFRFPQACRSTLKEENSATKPAATVPSDPLPVLLRKADPEELTKYAVSRATALIDEVSRVGPSQCSDHDFRGLVVALSGDMPEVERYFMFRGPLKSLVVEPFEKYAPLVGKNDQAIPQGFKFSRLLQICALLCEGSLSQSACELLLPLTRHVVTLLDHHQGPSLSYTVIECVEVLSALSKCSTTLPTVAEVLCRPTHFEAVKRALTTPEAMGLMARVTAHSSPKFKEVLAELLCTDKVLLRILKKCISRVSRDYSDHAAALVGNLGHKALSAEVARPLVDAVLRSPSECLLGSLYNCCLLSDISKDLITFEEGVFLCGLNSARALGVVWLLLQGGKEMFRDAAIDSSKRALKSEDFKIQEVAVKILCSTAQTAPAKVFTEAVVSDICTLLKEHCPTSYGLSDGKSLLRGNLCLLVSDHLSFGFLLLSCSWTTSPSSRLMARCWTWTSLPWFSLWQTSYVRTWTNVVR